MSTHQVLEHPARQESLCSLPLRVGVQGAAAPVIAMGVAATAALVRPGAKYCHDRPGGPPGAGASPARALILLRQAMIWDVHYVFYGVVEVDETYLVGA